MGFVITPHSGSTPWRDARARGFTLLEVLVVIMIAGITLGMVSFNAMPGDQQVLQKDAQRVALLMQTARDEAILRNRPILFESDGERYRFLIRGENRWEVIPKDDLLREREFSRPPINLLLNPSQTDPSPNVRIVFGREPVDKPFVLTLSTGDQQISIRADGIGHYEVE